MFGVATSAQLPAGRFLERTFVMFWPILIGAVVKTNVAVEISAGPGSPCGPPAPVDPLALAVPVDGSD
jgi:hypothetical protein